jgi:hypothetical protein
MNNQSFIADLAKLRTAVRIGPFSLFWRPFDLICLSEKHCMNKINAENLFFKLSQEALKYLSMATQLFNQETFLNCEKDAR